MVHDMPLYSLKRVTDENLPSDCHQISNFFILFKYI